MSVELPTRTALVVVDPYNDFTSRFGKGWLLVREVAKDVRLIENLKKVIHEARLSDIPVVYAPHARHRGAARRPQWPNPSQFLIALSRFFAEGGYGGKFRSDLAPAPGDFVATEHHISSAFGGSNLDAHLRSIGATHLILCGLLTNTCIESTARQAVDLGYEVTVLKDGVAAWSYADHNAAAHGSLRHVAHRIVTTDAIIASLSSAGA